MNLIESIVSSGHGRLEPSYVCIHETANPGATARNHRDYWSRDDTYAVHYVGDWTGECYHTVPDDRLCWQVGNGNSRVLGIELCHATNQADFERVWELGVEWAALMLSRRGWGVDRLISHDDARRMWGGTDHTDPIGYFAEFGRTWRQFVDDVDYIVSGRREADRLAAEERRKELEDLKRVSNGGGEVHRLYSLESGLHHYTADEGERDALVAAGWVYEGVAWEAPCGGSVAVYRMYDPKSDGHLLTASFEEAKAVQEAGWKYEGVPFFGGEGAEVFRLCNFATGEHLYTTDEHERASLLAGGDWADEGVAFRTA